MLRRTGFKRPVFHRTKPSKPVPIRQVAPTVISEFALAMPKQPRYVDRHLLDMARGESCLLMSPICNYNSETTVACHAGGVSNGKGMGYKVGDHLTVWGCSDCNHYTDAYNGATADEKTAVFNAGHVRQIKAWQAVLGNPMAPVADVSSARRALTRFNLT